MWGYVVGVNGKTAEHFIRMYNRHLVVSIQHEPDYVVLVFVGVFVLYF